MMSEDYIAILDLNTHKHRKVSLVNTPPSFPGIYVHAIEIYQDPKDLDAFTVFINSHRPPANREYAPETGAESVIEIFDTRLGSDELRWVKTVRDPNGEGLIWTPNSIAAVGPRQFYFTNDHKRKTAWVSGGRSTSKRIGLLIKEVHSGDTLKPSTLSPLISSSVTLLSESRSAMWLLPTSLIPTVRFATSLSHSFH